MSYGNITTVTGSTHNLGFTLTDTQSDSTQGIQPRFLDEGWPADLAAPPFIGPSFGNGRAHAVVPGQEATRPPAFQSFNFSIQRQIVADDRSLKSPTTAASAAACRPDCSHTTPSTRACSTTTERRC